MPALIALAAALVAALWGASAAAGPWPRERGEGFVALTGRAGVAELYGEYGLTAGLTLGVQATLPQGRRLPDLDLTARHLIWRGAGGAVVSAFAGAGLRGVEVEGMTETAQVLRGGLGWGRGFASALGPGWVSVVAEAQAGAGPLVPAWRAVKVDATAGVRPGGRWLAMIQVQGHHRAGQGADLRLEPSLGLETGRATLVLSPSVALRGPADARLTAGLWLRF